MSDPVIVSVKVDREAAARRGFVSNPIVQLVVRTGDISTAEAYQLARYQELAADDELLMVPEPSLNGLREALQRQERHWQQMGVLRDWALQSGTETLQAMAITGAPGWDIRASEEALYHSLVATGFDVDMDEISHESSAFMQRILPGLDEIPNDVEYELVTEAEQHDLATVHLVLKDSRFPDKDWTAGYSYLRAGNQLVKHLTLRMQTIAGTVWVDFRSTKPWLRETEEAQTEQAPPVPEGVTKDANVQLAFGLVPVGASITIASGTNPVESSFFKATSDSIAPKALERVLGMVLDSLDDDDALDTYVRGGRTEEECKVPESYNGVSECFRITFLEDGILEIISSYPASTAMAELRETLNTAESNTTVTYESTYSDPGRGMEMQEEPVDDTLPPATSVAENGHGHLLIEAANGRTIFSCDGVDREVRSILQFTIRQLKGIEGMPENVHFQREIPVLLRPKVSKDIADTVVMVGIQVQPSGIVGVEANFPKAALLGMLEEFYDQFTGVSDQRVLFRTMAATLEPAAVGG